MTKSSLEVVEQGSLDLLCSVYSIINAVSALYPELSDDERTQTKLFKTLLDTLASVKPKCTVGEICTKPVRPKHMRALLDRVREVLPAKYAISEPEKIVWTKNENDIDVFWRLLKENLGKNCAAIVLREGHWFVATAVTNKHVRVACSLGDTKFERSACGLTDNHEYQIMPGSSFLVRRANNSQTQGL